MGNCAQTKEGVNPAPPIKKDPSSKPNAIVFALMRNGHEVIRGNMKDIQEHLNAGQLDNAINSYQKLHKWMNMHKLMEEGYDGEYSTSPKGLFAVLDEKFNGIAKEKGLRDCHSELEEIETKMSDTINNRNLDKLKTSFVEYMKLNEDHLEKEEAVMMPLVMKMTKSGVDMKRLMVDDILALVIDSHDFQFFVEHANCILDKFSTDEKPKIRVFDHALRVCASDEQWVIWKEWMKASIPEETYNKVMSEIDG
mmetsp:Transcript_14547/g.20747  ORF Transcript_14547/g.20747 Transcript_14547/m.20747 type:complete len:252 (+) Transcript_14547:70-825(+)|eukprot:CAMPEP_0184872482 /NCGR_PEP_ID=MMETSP0580-20130426/41306_1 /TAXON_ID=1118495 /ORGANISM="Dactyliosolen fragilissimus" /LENGTH=251 /DNA_ID=CAMNT_0027375287 /DNA_START=37 /DNA_END=792 /DNA_ORIENTATION=+